MGRIILVPSKRFYGVACGVQASLRASVHFQTPLPACAGTAWVKSPEAGLKAGIGMLKGTSRGGIVTDRNSHFTHSLWDFGCPRVSISPRWGEREIWWLHKGLESGIVGVQRVPGQPLTSCPLPQASLRRSVLGAKERGAGLESPGSGREASSAQIRGALGRIRLQLLAPGHASTCLLLASHWPARSGGGGSGLLL